MPATPRPTVTTTEVPAGDPRPTASEDFAQFAYIVSHNLKEPLREVSIFAERLQRESGETLNSNGKEGLDHVLAGVRRINEILDDLFLYSQTGSWKLDPAPVDLNVLLNEVLFNLGTAIRESGATFTRGTLPTVVADRMQLMQLFENLIGNALKFRTHEAPRIYVRSQIEEGRGENQDQNFVVIAVQDNGIGIDRAYHDVIFKLFKRLHTRERYSGNGVGLAICERIAARHGGKIWVESSPGEGSTFYFKLPGGQGSHSRD